MNRSVKTAPWVAGLLAASLLLAGCGDDDTEPEAQPSIPTSSDPTPTSPEPTETTEPEPPTEREQAIAGAEQTVRDYYAFADELVADESIELDRLDSFLQNPELTDSRTFYQQFRDQGFYSEGGSTTFEWVKATKVQLYPKKGQAAVSLRVCRNADDVRVYFKSGKRIDLLSPSLATYEIYNYDYPSTSWKIAVENEPGERCQP